MQTNYDANASYGIHPKVISEIKSLEFSKLHNPSAIHRLGQHSRSLIEDSRRKILCALSKSPKKYSLTFTSGATESNNTAIISALLDSKKKGIVKPKIVITALEHHSIIELKNRIHELGGECIILKLDENNHTLDYETCINQIEASSHHSDVLDTVALFSCMYANNETGQIFPLESLFKRFKQNHPHILLHTDLVQGFGKIDTDFDSLSADLMSVSGHKIGGIAGIGALIAKKNLYIEPFLIGGPQEIFSRAGTENVIGIYTFGIAASLIEYTLYKRILIMKEKIRILRTIIQQEYDNVVFTLKESTPCLPNTLSMRFPGIRADDLVVALDMHRINTSSGAACASGKPNPSHVLCAMGIPKDHARETIRISVTGELDNPVKDDVNYTEDTLTEESIEHVRQSTIRNAQKILQCVLSMKRP
jgi:cysteine desulfurase